MRIQADAATRPRDRADFGARSRLESLTESTVAEDCSQVTRKGAIHLRMLKQNM